MTEKSHVYFMPLILSAILLSSVGSAVAVELGTESSRFTLDGKPTFLLGISYYGGLGAPKQFVRRDLDDMQRLGINWIRVWATWAAFGNDVTAVDHQGKPREPFLSQLQWLVAECDRRGIVVDVTLSRGNGVVGTPRMQTLEMHVRAVETIVSKLKQDRNWYLDLANERNINDQRFVSLDELRQLRATVRRLDPKRLVTASHAGEVRLEDVRRYVLGVGVDLLCPHRPRSAQSARQTQGQSRQCLAWMEKLGRVVPLHFQEPFRRGFTRGWEPAADDFVVDARGALRGGAAGWCLHNGSEGRSPDVELRRSFDMRSKRLFDQLDDVERDALEKLHRSFARGGD